MNEAKETARRLQTIVGSDCVVTIDNTNEWSVAVTVNGDALELSYWPTMEEDDWSTGEHRVIERPSARPYRVDSPRYSRGKTFARLDHARKAFLHEAMTVCMGAAEPEDAAGPSGSGE